MQLGCLRGRGFKSKREFLVDKHIGRRLHELLVAEDYDSIYVRDREAEASDEEVHQTALLDV